MTKKTSRKDLIVGLDIGSHSIKVVAVKDELGESILTSYNIKKIPSATKPSEKVALVKETLEEIDLNPASVNVSVSGPNVIVRFISLPKMTPLQLKDALAYEAEKYIPFNVNEVVIDSIILGPAAESGQMNVLLAAVKKDAIESRIKLAKDIGILVEVIDINPFAIFNLFTAYNPLGEDVSAFIDLGHSFTDILISEGKTPSFMRQLQIGGKDIVGALCKDLAVTPEKAEELMLGKEPGGEEQVAAAIKPVLENLVKELQLSFSYFENRRNKSVVNIFYTGGLTYVKGVLEHLDANMNVSSKTWNPVANMKVSEALVRQDLEMVSSKLTVCLGLALRRG